MNSLLRLLVAFGALSFAGPLAAATATGAPLTWAQKHAIAARKWAREKGHFRTVTLHHLAYLQFGITHCRDGTTVLSGGRSYFEHLRGGHLWVEHRLPAHPRHLWIGRCFGANRRHLFFLAFIGPNVFKSQTWLCAVGPKRRPRPLTPVSSGVRAAFRSGGVGVFAFGSHLVTTVDRGRHWLPQPSPGAGRIYQLKWLHNGRLALACIKATLVEKINSDGSLTPVRHGVAMPSGRRDSLLHFGWPDSWYCVYPPGPSKVDRLKEVDLRSGKVVAHIKVHWATTEFFLFHGGFVLVTMGRKNRQWICVYRTGNGKVALALKAKSNFGTMLEWRPHGWMVFGGQSHLDQFNIHTGKIEPTSVKFREWYVPPNPNSAGVIMESKAWSRALNTMSAAAGKLRGAYARRFLTKLGRLGKPGVSMAPWKWMRANTADVKKLYAEQEAAARK